VNQHWTFSKALHSQHPAFHGVAAGALSATDGPDRAGLPLAHHALQMALVEQVCHWRSVCVEAGSEFRRGTGVCVCLTQF